MTTSTETITNHHCSAHVNGFSQANFLREERTALERLLPGFDAAIRKVPFDVLESRESPAIAMLKKANGPSLLIPAEFGGIGATALEGARVLTAIASRSPSLGIAFTMHNFSVSTLVEWAIFGEEYGQALLSGLADGAMYVASGFAEGRTGARPLDMHMKARRSPDGGWLVTGKKKPCTLTYSMDFLSCGLVAETEPGRWRRAIGLIPADAKGIERKPFWNSPILAAAESDEVVLDDVHVPGDFVFVVDDDQVIDPVEVTGYIWFQLCVTATYLGVVSALVEQLLQSGKGSSEERGALVARLQAQAAAVDGIAYGLMHQTDRNELLARALSVRLSAQSVIQDVAVQSAELLGGMAFIGSNEVSYRMCACRAMAYHPPGRVATRALDEYACGGDLNVT